VIVSTARLDLHPLPLPVLDALLASDAATAQALLSFPLWSYEEDTGVMRFRQAQLRADPSELPWLFRAAVERSSGEVVARGGFHAPPDADGTVEIGYRVRADRRREGLATELATGLLGFAARSGAVRCLGSTAPDNIASQAVLARLGFVRTGEQWDDEDGLEWVFTCERLDAFR
jgi:[ribosomal protein S5]-alanine N-acetyltransferase